MGFGPAGPTNRIRLPPWCPRKAKADNHALLHYVYWMDSLDDRLEEVCQKYASSFSRKIYSPESESLDPLMNLFGITQELKRENKQYWGRELGMCFQSLVREICKAHCDKYQPGWRDGADEVCDVIVNKDAIDTKYRVGSGDSGTLKKFRQYGMRLSEAGFRPVMAIVRADNLGAAIQAARAGGWTVYQGNETFAYIETLTGFKLKEWLEGRTGRFKIDRLAH